MNNKKIETPAHIAVDRFGVADNSGQTRTYHAWSAVLASAGLMALFGQYQPADAITEPKPVSTHVVEMKKLPIIGSVRSTAKFNGGAGNWRNLVPAGLAVA